ncbi:hypothetical protein [Streptomyces mirabilis]|uniref:hypothetical protein n=1 Tax=Streptomyces mirabilis TaxID=68239 RepID=UPI002258E3DE|nr:hypothetical protein [Streptomyces mirabilis]MCX4429515.1 hypothetical protein [Streptomyces mirabilis]
MEAQDRRQYAGVLGELGDPHRDHTSDRRHPTQVEGQAGTRALADARTALTIRFGCHRVPESTNPRASERTAQKVRRQEQGHQYAQEQLVALGAPRPRPGCDPAIWLREALASVGARNVRHRGAHRYVFRLGRTRREREEIRLGLPAQQPYPKRPDLESASS